jgi:hypothetical protein
MRMQEWVATFPVGQLRVDAEARSYGFSDYPEVACPCSKAPQGRERLVIFTGGIGCAWFRKKSSSLVTATDPVPCILTPSTARPQSQASTARHGSEMLPTSGFPCSVAEGRRDNFLQ